MKKRFLLTLFMLAFAVFTNAQTHWTAPTGMQYNMTGTVVVFVNGSSIMGSADIANLEIGAFVGDECRGCKLPQVNTFPVTAATYPYVYTLMIYSESSYETGITFRLYNHETGEEECLDATTTVTFQADEPYGNMLAPFQVNFVEATCFLVTATANPTAGGTVAGGGHIREGNTCTVNATADGCYQFVNWTAGSTVVSSNASYTFTPTEDIDLVANFQAGTYDIAASVNPVGTGTVTGAGTYDCGSTCTLSATPATGYIFVNWTKGGVEVSTNAEYSFTVNEAGSYVANFSLEPYEITATANPTEGGTVAVEGPLTYGSTCTLTATAAEHYNFVNWTKGGEIVSTNAEYSFTVEGPGAYVANFELSSCEVTATANPTEGGSVSGMGTVNYGGTCTLTATANNGYTFVNWTNLTGAEVSTEASYTFTVTEGVSLVANFIPKQYSVTAAANPTEGGIVTVSPTSATGTYNYGQQIKLRAVSKLGYEFVNWTMTGGAGETVAYTLDGTIKGGTNGYATESDITQNGIGWKVTGNTDINPWRIGGKSLSNIDRPIYSTSTISDNITKIVVTHGTNNAVTVNSMTLIVSANADFSDPVSTLTGTYEAESATTFNRPDGADWSDKYFKLVYNVSVSATSNKNFEFISAEFYKSNGGSGSSVVASTESNYTFTLNDETEGAYVANFEAIDPLPAVPTETHWTFNSNMQYSMNITGVMVLDGDAMKNNDLAQYLEIGAFVGDECRGSYLPSTYNLPFAQGYFYEMTLYSENGLAEQVVFKVWNHINNEELDVTCLSNITFEADGNLGNLQFPQELEFETNLTMHYNIVASANIAEGGVVTGTGSYEEDASCTLTATANYGYDFINWTKGDEAVSTEASYTFTVTEDATYVANFNPKSYSITVNAPAVGGTVTGAGTYTYNTQCVLTATAATGYHFVEWTSAGVSVSTDASYGFTVTADATYDAVFEINSYEITAVASPDVAGTIEGAGTYNHFAECTVTATPNAKFVFEKWTENGVEIEGAGATYTFEVDGPRNLVANFAPIYTIAASIDKDIAVEEVVPGTVEGAGDVIKNQPWSLVATANEGYTFYRWYEVVGGNRVLYSDEATIGEEHILADHTFVAYFTLNKYDIAVTVAPDETPAVAQLAAAGTVTGYGEFYHYDTCTLVATPSLGYHFVNWTEGGVEVSTQTTLEFIVTEGRDLVANFELDTHVIAVTIVDVTVDKPEAAPAIPGTVTGADTYNYYDTCTLVATPEVGYHFVNWTEGGVEVSTETTLEFMVTEDRDLVANFELDTHVIDVTVVNLTTDLPAAAPAVPGTVTGADTYNYYAICTLVATPEVGYHFVNWTEGGVEVSTETTLEFMVTEDRDLVANFEIDSHVIAITVTDLTENKPEAAPAIPGTVTGAGTYYYYTEIALVATPATGFHFVNWTEGGVEVSTETTLEFMVTEDRDLVANFELDTHVIAVTILDVTVDKPEAAPAVPGTVTGADTYNYYATCTLVATPEEGYHFVNWTEGGVEVSTETTIEFMVVEDRNFVANFELDSHVIAATVVNLTTDLPEAAPTVPGTVTGAGTCNYYATCTLVATPEVGYHFVNWTEGLVEVSTEATLEFMVTEDRDLMANFELDTHTLTLNLVNITENTPAAAPEIPGTVTINDGDYILDDNHQVELGYYTEITLVATPEVGFHFVNWTDAVTGEEIKDGMGEPIGAEYEFMVVEDRNIRANFELDTYVIAVEVVDLTVDKPEAAPVVPGTVTGADTYTHYATCTLVATPATGYHFVNWTENDVVIDEATTNTYEFMVTAGRNIKANFELNNYTIAAAPNDNQFGSVTGAGDFNHYATCELVATPATGYHFVNWTEGSQAVSTSATYSFMVTEARDLVANFEINSYNITATANPTAGGTITGAGTYNHFATCALVATPATGYHFVNWTVGGQIVSTEASYSFEVTEAVALVANFEINSYQIVVSANPSNYGTVTGGGTYNHFDNCTLVATAGTGHTFVNWTKDGEDYSTNATISFTVDGPATFVAHFINRYTINATANNAVYGTVEGAGIYNEGSNVTLTATPNTGYHFVNWTLNGQVVSTNASYTFEATANGDYVGNFEVNNYEIAATVAPEGYGTIMGAGNYDHFATCTLTATATQDYYQFVNWTENSQVVATTATYSFEVTGARNLVANFVLIEHEITAVMNPTDAGTITGAGTYYHTYTCTLVANPTQDYLFMNWTENGQVVATTATYSFEVTGPRNLVANCIPNTYEITATATPPYGGTVTGAGIYYYNTSCTLTATANTGFHFVNWTKDGQVVSTNSELTFTVTANADYVANFASNQYTVVTMSVPAEGGTTTGGGTFNYGTTCALNATPNEGYHFVNWTDDNGVVLSTSPVYMFNVVNHALVIAHFEINTYNITASADPTVGGTVEGAGTYEYGATCTLTATANTGYTFVNWTKDGQVVTTNASFSVTVTEAAAYIAHFNLNSYEITATSNPSEGGTVTGTGTYEYGATCTLTASANTGYTFIKWTKNGQEVSTNASYSFTVTEAAAYIAHFELNSYVITAEADPEEGGEVTGNGVYNHGETVTMTATANPDYRFVNWTENGEVVSDEATFTFTADGDRQLVAHFESTVGVMEYGALSVTVYPNPAEDKLFIEMDRPADRCEIYSINGALILTLNDCGDKFEIEVSNLMSGTYIVRVVSDSMVKNVRFVKL